MASVTIPGAVPGSPITETFGNTANLTLALQIRDALVAAGNAGVLNVTVAGGGLVSGPPTNTPAGGVNELVINAAGSYTIPAGSAGRPDYVVVIDPATSGNVTIHGAANSTILGGNAHVTIVDPDLIVLGEEAGNAAVTINGIGDVLAGNNLDDTLTAAGFQGSIAGGTGRNLFRDLGANDTISAQGTSDTIFGGSNSATIQLLGASIFDNGTPFGTPLPGARNALVVGGNGPLTVTDAGTADTITGGTITGANSGALNVTLSGSAASVVGGTFGPLFVTDNGIGDTITAGGFGFTSVSAATSDAFVQGGAGLLNFVGGAGNSTIMGGSGGATIFGGTGATLLFGGPGGEMTYVNTTAGSLYYRSGSGGNEIIDASFSKSPIGFNETLGGAGHNVMIGGAGNDAFYAGADVDTLVGGGGANTFDFWTQFGGPAVNHLISDFSAIDHVNLIGYSFGEATAAIAGAQTTGGSTTITLSDNTKITFTGVTDPAALTGHIG